MREENRYPIVGFIRWKKNTGKWTLWHSCCMLTRDYAETFCGKWLVRTDTHVGEYDPDGYWKDTPETEVAYTIILSPDQYYCSTCKKKRGMCFESRKNIQNVNYRVMTTFFEGTVPRAKRRLQEYLELKKRFKDNYGILSMIDTIEKWLKEVTH